MNSRQYKRVPEELKQKILEAVKHDGLSVRKASQEYGVSQQTVHLWIKKESVGLWTNSYTLWEIRRLKKDKEDLLCLIWALTAELDKTKKKK